MARKQTFGEFLRDRRLEAGLGLRAFAVAAGLQPSNLSNIEHSRIPPPQDRKVLARIARLLGFEEGSADWVKLFDLAVKGRDRLPADVAAFAATTPGIPALLRTIDNRRLSQEEITQLTQYLETLRRPRR